MTRLKLVTATATATAFPQQLSVSSSSSPSKELSPSIPTTVLFLIIAFILLASLYLLLRFFRRKARNRHSTTVDAAVHRYSSSTESEESLGRVTPIINSLPLFTNKNQFAGDCTVCLSKFENDDVLRLLPVCCHAFHAECIDTWLRSNLTCPLCRSPINLSATDVIGKISCGNNDGNQRGTATSTAEVSGEITRSSSIRNSVDVIAGEDDVVAEVRISIAEYNKETDETAEQQEVSAAEVERISCTSDSSSCSCTCNSSSSSESSSCSCTCNPCSVEVKTENEGYEVDEMNRLDYYEIHELFRWMTGN